MSAVEVAASRFLEEAGTRPEVIVDRVSERETAEVAWCWADGGNDARAQAWTQVQLVLATDGSVDFDVVLRAGG